jgi:hypothetical protein
VNPDGALRPGINVVIATNTANPGESTVASCSQHVEIVQRNGRTVVRDGPGSQAHPHDKEDDND